MLVRQIVSVNVLHSVDEAVLFQRLKKYPTRSPVHQWDERTAVGSDDGAWVPEAGNAEEADQTIARKFTTAKYLQTLRKVTLQASISNMIEDAVALEKNAGTLWIVRNVEKILFDGNSALYGDQPDGLDVLIPSTNVIDLRGATAESATFEDKMNESTRIIRDNFGKANCILGSTKFIQDVQKLLRDRLRFEAREGGLGGTVFSHYPTPFGTPELKDDIFINEGDDPLASSLTTKRPDAPTIGGTSSPVDAASQFAANDAGDYVYKAVDSSRFGDSVASAESIVSGVAAGDRVDLPLTEGVTAGTAWKIYRSIKDGATGAATKFAFRVAHTTSPETIADFNADLPGTGSSYILTLDPIYDAVEWAQFLPMMKFDLYPTAAAVYPFLILLFGSLALKKPVQHVRIKNISPSDLGFF